MSKINFYTIFYITFGCSKAYLMKLEDLDIMMWLNLVIEYFFSNIINSFLVIDNNGKNVISVEIFNYI